MGHRIRLVSLLVCVALLMPLVKPDLVRAVDRTAEQVRQATGVQNGLAIVLGTTDGKLEAGLAAEGKLLVQGLTTEPAAAQAARAHLFDQQLYGLASVDVIEDLTGLPYYNRLVNLVVADLDALGDEAPTPAEITRVLAFEGVAYLKEDGEWKTHRKPTPDDVAEWTHYHYDATRSNFSPDKRVGPPNALRWVGKPSDHNGYLGVRVGNGVTFVRSGTGSGNKSPEDVDNRTPMIVAAKDAHSGVTLWAKDQTKYRRWDRGMEWGVVGDDCLFVYTRGTEAEGWGRAGYSEVAIEAWDQRTGETKHRWVLGNLVSEDKAEEAMLEQYFSSEAILAAADGKIAYNLGPKLIVRDQHSGQIIWQKDHSADQLHVRRFMIADGRLIAMLRVQEEAARGFQKKHHRSPLEAIIAWSLKDGKQLWRLSTDDLLADVGMDFVGNPTSYELTGYRDGLLPVMIWDSAGRGGNRGVRAGNRAVVALLDVKTGRRLWATPTTSVDGSWGVIDRYITGGMLHIAKLTSIQTSFDLQTGREIKSTRWGGSGRSSNCCSGTATADYLVMQRNYIPWDAVKEYSENNALKVPDLYYTKLFSFACRAKISPAYGTTYNPSGSCNCTAFLPGSTALYALQETTPLADDTRLRSGYAGAVERQLPRQQKAMNSAVAFDWTLRPGRTAMTWSAPRTGSQKNRGKGSTEAWGYGRHETEPIQVGDLTITGYVDEHRIEAKRDGQPVWNFIAGGRIGFRGPLQADDKRLYFASHDGYIYAVNHEDGSLAWRFLAAPADKRMVAFGQVESAWPLFNVVLHEGKIYGCAGRHQELDGGLHFYRLDAATGKIEWHVRRRLGIADAENEGAIHGAWQQRSARWADAPGRPNAADDWTTSSQYALNGKLVVKDGKLVLTPEAWHPLEMDLDNPRDVTLNEHTFTPPGAESAVTK